MQYFHFQCWVSIEWIRLARTQLWREYCFAFHHNALQNKTCVCTPFGSCKLFCDLIFWWEFHKLTNAEVTSKKSTFLYLSQGVAVKVNVDKQEIICFDLKIIVSLFFERSSQFLFDLNFERDWKIKWVRGWYTYDAHIEGGEGKNETLLDVGCEGCRLFWTSNL